MLRSSDIYFGKKHEVYCPFLWRREERETELLYFITYKNIGAIRRDESVPASCCLCIAVIEICLEFFSAEEHVW